MSCATVRAPIFPRAFATACQTQTRQQANVNQCSELTHKPGIEISAGRQVLAVGQASFVCCLDLGALQAWSWWAWIGRRPSAPIGSGRGLAGGTGPVVSGPRWLRQPPRRRAEVSPPRCRHQAPARSPAGSSQPARPCYCLEEVILKFTLCFS